MRIVAQTAAAMQAVFGTSLDDLARTTRCVRRQRKFSGVSLARTLVLTILLRPAAKNRDYQAMAAKAGVHVTEEAIDHRFTAELVLFLEGILRRAVSQVLAGKASTTPLLRQFSDVRIGDSTTLTLPDEFADRFPSCGGSENASLAAMKIQVLWSVLTGRLLGWQITSGRVSDARSEMAEVFAAGRIVVRVRPWLFFVGTVSSCGRSGRLLDFAFAARHESFRCGGKKP